MSKEPNESKTSKMSLKEFIEKILKINLTNWQLEFLNNLGDNPIKLNIQRKWK